MTEPESRKQARDRASRPAPKGTKRRGGTSPGQPFTINFPHTQLLHQARVLAMQSLYEADLTDHTLDDVLQHMGVPKRAELEAYFRETRTAAYRAIDAIDVLARNVDRAALADGDAAREELAGFNAASHAIVDELSKTTDEADGEPVDGWLASVQKQVARRTHRILVRSRDATEAVIEVLGTLPAPNQELEELLEVVRRGNTTADAASTPGGMPDWGTGLTNHSAATRKELDAFLGPAEQQSLGHLLDMLRHAERLVRGVEMRQSEIDPLIERAAPAFPMPQLASIDRVVLRLAVYELLHEPQVPMKAAINEAVEIAKRYGGPKSGSFVNGVLRTISESLPKESDAAS